MPAWFVKHHILVIAGAGVALLASTVLLFYPGLRHDYRLEAFVAGHDESYRTFRRFMEEFSSNEVAVIAYRTDDAVSPAASAMARELIGRVRGLQAVENVVAVAALPALLRRLLGERLYAHPLVQDTLLSRDQRTAAIIVQIAGEAGSEAQRRTNVAALKSIVEEARTAYSEVEFHLAGPYVTLMDMYAYVDRDLLVFSLAAFGLLSVTLALVFRRPGPMVYAMGVSVAATVCTLGLSVVLGIVASLITQMIVILVTVLSVATCVHLAVAVEEEARSRALLFPFPEEWSALATAVLERMHKPCTAMVTTTAVGFGSVCISTIAPIRSFGFLMSVGLLFALVLSYAGCVLWVRWMPSIRHGRTPASEVTPRGGSSPPDSASPIPRLLRLGRLGAWLCRHRGLVLGAGIAGGLFCALGMGRLRFESDFVKNFRPASEVRRGYEFVEKNLAPVGSVEVVVRRRDGSTMATPDALSRAHALGAAVVDRFPTIRKALTLADAIDDGASSLPTSQRELDARLAWARLAFGNELIRGFVNADRTALRVNLRAREGVNVGEKLRIDEEIRAMAESAFGPAYHVTVTGLYHFYAELIAGLVRSQYLSFGLTLPGVYLMIWLSFRSTKMALLAMIPNLPPMVLCVGVMGWTGVPVNMTTAMMLSVSFGIAVDDAIHYLWRFQEEFTARGDYRAAIIASHASVGRACVIVTLTVAGGFWILVLSQFLPTAYFGALIGVTMAGALGADLLLLPVMILLLRPFGRERSKDLPPEGPGAPVDGEGPFDTGAVASARGALY